MAKRIPMIGGPLDGMDIPHDPYFTEGAIEAVDTLAFAQSDAKWSDESVYRMTDGKLVYDAKATKKRRLINGLH